MKRLVKAMKEGKVNRDVACATILRAKNGSSILLDLSRSNKNNPHIIRSVVKAFKNLDPADPLSELMVKELFDNAK